MIQTHHHGFRCRGPPAHQTGKVLRLGRSLARAEDSCFHVWRSRRTLEGDGFAPWSFNVGM